MKKDLHPTYHKNAKITCSCGTVFIAGSTRDELSVETCSQCHPFYTGKQKIVDSTGRVNRFEKLREKAQKQAQGRKKFKTKAEKEALRAEKKTKQEATQ